MPAVLDTPELRDLAHVETYELPIERPLARPACPGFWRTLMQRIGTYLTPRRHERHVPACHGHRPYEAPIDRFVREQPLLAVYALAIF
jgi:hypothetical protein